MAPERPGHRGDLGGGKPTPTTVSSVPHAGTMAGSEWYTSAHRAMQEGGEVKETAPGRGGGEGGHLQGFQQEWTPPLYGDLF